MIITHHINFLLFLFLVSLVEVLMFMCVNIHLQLHAYPICYSMDKDTIYNLVSELLLYEIDLPYNKSR